MKISEKNVMIGGSEFVWYFFLNLVSPDTLSVSLWLSRASASCWWVTVYKDKLVHSAPPAAHFFEVHQRGRRPCDVILRTTVGKTIFLAYPISY